MFLSGRCKQSAGAPILADVFFGKGGIPQISAHTVVDPTLRKKREGHRLSYCAAPAMVAIRKAA